MKITIHLFQLADYDHAILEIRISDKSHENMSRKDYLTPVEVFEEYDLLPERLQHHVQEGDIPFLRLDDKYTFARYAVEKLLKEKGI